MNNVCFLFGPSETTCLPDYADDDVDDFRDDDEMK